MHCSIKSLLLITKSVKNVWKEINYIYIKILQSQLALERGTFNDISGKMWLTTLIL